MSGTKRHCDWHSEFLKIVFSARKICKNCKCKQDDHDVKIEDNDHVRKIGHLFDKSTRQQYTISKMTVPQNAKLNKPEPSPGKKDSSNQVTFEWIPQGTSDELVGQFLCIFVLK